jgi:hypothetical protein
MGFAAGARHFAEHSGTKTQAIQGELLSFCDAIRAGKRPAPDRSSFFNGLLVVAWLISTTPASDPVLPGAVS